MTVASKTVSAEELLRMAEDGHRYELVHGEVRKMAPAGGEHGLVAMRVGISLGSHAKERGLGEVVAAETGFLLAADPDHVRAADVAFVGRSTLTRIRGSKGYWKCTPDLVVEVVSPNDPFAEVEDKVFDWLQYGAQMVIVINPKKRTATVYRSPTDITHLDENNALDGANVVPGWRLPLAELFV